MEPGLEGGPERAKGYRVWRDRSGGVEVRFVGKGPPGAHREVLEALEPRPPEAAWVHQIHSARVVTVAAGVSGPQGRGDALISGAHDLALAVVTADCVPVVLAGRRTIAAIHAGWRGIAADVVGETLARLGERPTEVVAWIGPAIGPCCYEVGAEVAEEVASASDPGVVLARARQRPHLDLAGAVTHQLRRRGVEAVRTVVACTRCDSGSLWSYRRDGKGAGRNLAFIWRAASRP